VAARHFGKVFLRAHILDGISEILVFLGQTAGEHCGDYAYPKDKEL
jgi:hypothetical protein